MRDLGRFRNSQPMLKAGKLLITCIIMMLTRYDVIDRAIII